MISYNMMRKEFRKKMTVLFACKRYRDIVLRIARTAEVVLK
jgi:hypothetical protein